MKRLGPQNQFVLSALCKQFAWSMPSHTVNTTASGEAQLNVSVNALFVVVAGQELWDSPPKMKLRHSPLAA